jgi:hypothetical protein
VSVAWLVGATCGGVPLSSRMDEPTSDKIKSRRISHWPEDRDSTLDLSARKISPRPVAAPAKWLIGVLGALLSGHGRVVRRPTTFSCQRTVLALLPGVKCEYEDFE